MILELMTYKGKKSRVCAPEEGYNLYADIYEGDIGYLNSFEKDVLINTLGDLKGKRVLDLGAGTGRMIHHLRNLGATVVAVDVSEKMLERLKKRYADVECHVADVENLPFEDESFDLVLAAFLIVHLGDLTTAFDEAYRVLKPGGYFVVTNINQRRAPKLKLKNGEGIVIDSYYHRPEDVLKALNGSFFEIKKEDFVMEGKAWTNQIIKAFKN